MSGRWDIEHVDLAEANAMADIFRAAQAEADATYGVTLAAMCLCMFNICGIGGLARKRGRDVKAEMLWFTEAFIRTMGELVESRYDHN